MCPCTNVPVYDNGYLFAASHGKNHASDGYYYGQKWQCVEFVKRFYSEALGHRMPDGWGHAKDYYDPAIAHRALNPRRGMIQFVNGGDEPPAVDDLLVFRGAGYGHVAVISSVTADRVEVIQQNIFGRPRQIFELQRAGGCFRIVEPNAPAGWLRVPARL